MRFLDLVCAERSVFRTSTSEHCGLIKTTARAYDEEICQVLAQGLNCDSVLPDFSANDNSATGWSSRTSCNGGNSRGTGVSSSLHRIVH